MLMLSSQLALATTTLNAPAANADLVMGQGFTYNATTDVTVAAADTTCTFSYTTDGNTYNTIGSVSNSSAMSGNVEFTVASTVPTAYGIDAFRASCTATNSTDTTTETDDNTPSQVSQYGTGDATDAGTDIVGSVLVQIAQLVGVIVIMIVLVFVLVRLRKHSR